MEIDQWFWRLPDPATAAEYARSVPEAFRFTIKVPNLITLTHPYAKRKGDPLGPQPDLPVHGAVRGVPGARSGRCVGRIGALIFQFEYLNKQKMPSQAEFLERLEAFFDGLPAGGPPCVRGAAQPPLAGRRLLRAACGAGAWGTASCRATTCRRSLELHAQWGG